MASATQLARMSAGERMVEAMRRSLPLLPAEAGGIVSAMISPASLAITLTTLGLWAGSHFIGVGEIVDIVLLGAGALTLGFAVFDGARDLLDFASMAVQAQTDAELDLAGRSFARAVTVLGISTVQALLMRGQARTVQARPTVFGVRPAPKVGAAPPAGDQLKISRPATIPGGLAGGTSPFGVIQVARNQPLDEQRLTLFHELLHRYFSPRTGPLLKLRAELRISAYQRSALLRYLEEALAEGYGQLRVHGLAQALGAYRFPIANGYMTVSQLVSEGLAIGTISLGGVLFKVSMSQGTRPTP